VLRVESQTPGGGRARRTALTCRPATSGRQVHPQVGRILRRLACVPMMQASDHAYLDDAALVGVLHESRLRGVLLQGEVCSSRSDAISALASRPARNRLGTQRARPSTLRTGGQDDGTRGHRLTRVRLSEYGLIDNQPSSASAAVLTPERLRLLRKPSSTASSTRTTTSPASSTLTCPAVSSVGYAVRTRSSTRRRSWPGRPSTNTRRARVTAAGRAARMDRGRHREHGVPAALRR
jgi:hypothetical protein